VFIIETHFILCLKPRCATFIFTVTSTTVGMFTTLHQLIDRNDIIHLQLIN